jgi:hypothetical protein
VCGGWPPGVPGGETKTIPGGLHAIAAPIGKEIKLRGSPREFEPDGDRGSWASPGGGFERVLAAIDTIDDTELLEVGIFDWAGNRPIARWISVSTARRYTTARTVHQARVAGA